MPVCLVDRVSARGEDVANRGRQESLEGVKHRPQRGDVRAGRRREIEVRQTVTARETSTTDTYTVNAHELTLWLSPAGGSSGTVCHWRVRRTLEGIRFAHAHHSPGAAPHPPLIFSQRARHAENGGTFGVSRWNVVGSHARVNQPVPARPERRYADCLSYPALGRVGPALRLKEAAMTLRLIRNHTAVDRIPCAACHRRHLYWTPRTRSTAPSAQRGTAGSSGPTSSSSTTSRWDT